MGMSFMKACGGLNPSIARSLERSANPDPFRFEVEWAEERASQFVLARIYYTGCTNYEGRKLLILHGITKDELMQVTRLDPHFQEKPQRVIIGGAPKLVRVLARFEPSDIGLELANSVVNAIIASDNIAP